MDHPLTKVVVSRPLISDVVRRLLIRGVVCLPLIRVVDRGVARAYLHLQIASNMVTQIEKLVELEVRKVASVMQ